MKIKVTDSQEEQETGFLKPYIRVITIWSHQIVMQLRGEIIDTTYEELEYSFHQT